MAPCGSRIEGATVINSVYIIGSLRNPAIPGFANELAKACNLEAFADWFSPGPAADDYWRDYSKERGLNYRQALQSYAATHIFEFDKHHLERCDAVVMLMPAGKSGHLELGYAIGKGKPGYILFDGEPERYDVMTQFATGIFFDKEDLFQEINKANWARGWKEVDLNFKKEETLADMEKQIEHANMCTGCWRCSDPASPIDGFGN